MCLEGLAEIAAREIVRDGFQMCANLGERRCVSVVFPCVDLTVRGPASRMDPMGSRRVAVITSLALLIGFIPTFATVCIGWDASAKTRMACCAKSDAAGSLAAADACCKDGEGRTNALTQSGLVAWVIPPPMQFAVAVTLSLTSSGRPSDSLLRTRSSLLYLLDSVFRI